MTTLQKPPRGTVILERRARRAERRTVEKKAIAEAKQRDRRCRWPEPHKCYGGLEGSHIQDKSLTGLNAPENIVALCAWIHRRGPESIHGKQLKIEKETMSGANGPLSFWRQTGKVDGLGQPIYHCIAREKTPFLVERD